MFASSEEQKVRFGETPKPALETSALPGILPPPFQIREHNLLWSRTRDR